MMSANRLLLLSFSSCLLACAAGSDPKISLDGPTEQALSAGDKLVIRQIYGGGGNAGATYKNDFVELFNAGASSVSLSSLSLQYTSAKGASDFGSTAQAITVLPSVTLAPGQSYLVQGDQGTAGSQDLPMPFLSDATPFSIGAKDGRMALVSGADPLKCRPTNCPSAACNPVPCNQDPRVIDLVGFGPGDGVAEGTPAAVASNTLAVSRLMGGCQDSDDNSADFELIAPQPRTQNSPRTPCVAVAHDAGHPVEHDAGKHELDAGTVHQEHDAGQHASDAGPDRPAQPDAALPVGDGDDQASDAGQGAATDAGDEPPVGQQDAAVFRGTDAGRSNDAGEAPEGTAEIIPNPNKCSVSWGSSGGRWHGFAFLALAFAFWRRRRPA